MVNAGLCGHCKNLAILLGIRRYAAYSPRWECWAVLESTDHLGLPTSRPPLCLLSETYYLTQWRIQKLTMENLKVKEKVIKIGNPFITHPEALWADLVQGGGGQVQLEEHTAK